METKYNIGETIWVPREVEGIRVNDDGDIIYEYEAAPGATGEVFEEDVLTEVDDHQMRREVAAALEKVAREALVAAKMILSGEDDDEQE